MKTCGYCRTENEAERSSCRGCGTELAEILEKTEVAQTTSESQLAKVTAFAGFKLAALWTSALIALLGLYLLSFGPIARWYIIQVPPPLSPAGITNAGGGVIEVIDYAISYPKWADAVYGPLFGFLPLTAEDSQSLAGLYERYLRWWQKKPDASP